MKVGLFVPCYVDALYPEAGVATYKLLKHYGLDVDYPEKQTCCGQPMANAGFQDKSEKVIETFDELFKDYDYIVALQLHVPLTLRCITLRFLRVSTSVFHQRRSWMLWSSFTMC